MAELVNDLVLVSLGMGISVVLMCIVQVSKMADEEMEEIKKERIDKEWIGFKREFSKLIGFLVIALIAVGLVFNAGGVKDVLLELFNRIIGA